MELGLLRRVFNRLRFNRLFEKIPLNPPLEKGEDQSHLGYLAPSIPLEKGDYKDFPPFLKGGQGGF